MKPSPLALAAPAIALALLTACGTSASAGDAPSWSWQQPHATVLPSGGLAWAPTPFAFAPGDAPRYVDFDAGDDANDGATRQTAWKHHPWDARATGAAKACSGIHTYIFKGGVAYRGTLKAAQSGAQGNPIRLTRDPQWGSGAAAIYGSLPITGGWSKAGADDAPGIPSSENLWYIDLGTLGGKGPLQISGGWTAALWQVGGGTAQRLHIARLPHYDPSDANDPVKNWPTFSAYDAKTRTLTAPALKGLGGKDLLKGATIWVEGGFLMASASPGSLGQAAYDPAAGTLSLNGFGYQLDHRYATMGNIHFMLENSAAFLAAPGEFFVQNGGPKAGRLFLRPWGGVDPNRVTIEVAQTSFLLTLADQHDIAVSGLEFRYNSPEGLKPNEWNRGNGSPAPCIRLVGSGTDISIDHCAFIDVAAAFEAGDRRPFEAGPSGPGSQERDRIVFADNDVLHASRSEAVSLHGGRHLEVLRNRVVDTGFRHGYCAWDTIPAIVVAFPETCEIAGNIVERSFGNGIITFGGKESGEGGIAPLTRILVHHNQIDNTMLGCNDYGGLEHFQGGPVYLYDNITRNAVGNRTLGVELGYNLYLDGAFKCYTFNNIIAGLVKADHPDYANNCGYFMVFGFLNQFFNNTVYHFKKAIDGSSGNRSNILGNLMLDCTETFIGQNRPGDVSMMGGGDTGAMGRMGIPTMAYASNVFHGHPATFGEVAGTSAKGSGGGAPVAPGKTLEELRDRLQAESCRLASLGWNVDAPPLADPAKLDYRPVADSGARERGVKYFVPWALARNVGEWDFYKSAAHPQVVLGEGFYMTDEYRSRDMYYFIPRNDLTVSACTAADYIAGPLEDWIEGALTFDGTRTASLTHAEMTRSMDYPGGPKGATVPYNGAQRETLDMGTNDFLIEAVFKAAPGSVKGVLAAKLGQSGYELAINPGGGVRLSLRADSAVAAASSTKAVADGAWHHVLAEVDRKAGRIAIFVDGAPAGGGTLDGLPAEAPVSNTADFSVGRELTGAVNYLRVCRSTLAASKTSIAELYAWEFDGPFLRDFAGTAPLQRKRDAGALQGGAR